MKWYKNSLRLTNMATIDDLLKDWQDRANNNPMQYTHYIEKFKELVEYMVNPRFAIVPYRRENGHMDYRLRVIDDERRSGREILDRKDN